MSVKSEKEHIRKSELKEQRQPRTITLLLYYRIVIIIIIIINITWDRTRKRFSTCTPERPQNHDTRQPIEQQKVTEIKSGKKSG